MGEEDIEEDEKEKKGEAVQINEDMKLTMLEKVGIYRNEKAMTAAVDKITVLREEYNNLSIGDTNKAFNTELLELIELKNLLDLALITAVSARNRKESRGAHRSRD